VEKDVIKIRHDKLKKRTSKKKLSSLVKRLILFSFLALAVIWLGMQVFNFCVFQAIRTVEAQTGVLTATAKAKGVLLFQEEVVRAPVSGELEPLAAEGTRLSIDTVVGHIKPLTGPDGSAGSVELKSPSAGIVCYSLDGWEGVYDRLSWQHTDPVLIFNNITEETKETKPQKEVLDKGEPIFKVIDNLENPYIIIQFAAGYASHVKEGARLQLTWGKDQGGRGKVISLIDKKGNMYTIVELEQVRSFPCQRLLELEVSCRKGEGVIVPDSALVKEDGENEVYLYIMSVTGPVVKNVEVVTVLDGQVAVQGISPGADVVKNPGVARLIKKDI
jgi:putative membrane fusion protein